MAKRKTATVQMTGATDTITATRRGYTVAQETIWQGGHDGRKVLVYYSKRLPRGLDLSDHDAIEDIRLEASCYEPGEGRVLRAGHGVA